MSCSYINCTYLPILSFTRALSHTLASSFTDCHTQAAVQHDVSVESTSIAGHMYMHVNVSPEYTHLRCKTCDVCLVNDLEG